MLVSLFAYTPGPILFGYIIDDTCLVWNYKCGERGHCQLYDSERFRDNTNLAAIALAAVGVFFDVLVWMHSKHMKLYTDPDRRRDDQSQNQIEK